MRLTETHRAATAPSRAGMLVRAGMLALALAGPGGRAAIAGEAGLPATRVETLALGGFDPVSYFLDGGPRPGSPRHEASRDGRVYRFASAADLAAFRADPEVYAPRLGGNDALGVLDGRLVDADPAVFAVVGDRLYLFRDAGRRARFLADPAHAAAAEAAWPGLRGLADAPGD